MTSALLTPTMIGSLALPNRVVMASMHTGLEDSARSVDRWIAYLQARCSVGLIITGGVSPDRRGALTPRAAVLSRPSQLAHHRHVTDAVHEAGGRIGLQLLHAGRYAVTPWASAPSAVPAPGRSLPPIPLTDKAIRATIDHYATATELAVAAGYDAVEIMGSEGYLVSQFLAPATNQRNDAWGGDATRRREFPLRVAQACVAAAGEVPVIFRLSLADLIPAGQTWQQITELAELLQHNGVAAFMTGIGWHESKVPTIMSAVPPAAWTSWTRRLREHVTAPVIASNRINTPDLAEAILQSGDADLVAMARPLLADPDFVSKVAQDRSESINVCIGCNQECLDQVFAGRSVSCVVNPWAGQERLQQNVFGTRLASTNVAVVGAGPAGLAAAVTAAELGHQVTIFDKHADVGGQFRYAAMVPGKSDYALSLRYYQTRLAELGAELITKHEPSLDELAAFDHRIISTGVMPHIPDLPGVDLPHVVSYADVFEGRCAPGAHVVIIGAGGVAVDMAHFLAGAHEESTAEWMAQWGVGDGSTPGALIPREPRPRVRHVTLVQRSSGKIGARMGRTTAWAHREVLRASDVHVVSEATVDRFTAEGAHVRVAGIPTLLRADTVVLCTGAVPGDDLAERLTAQGLSAHRVGGALDPVALDAGLAIRSGTQVATKLCAGPQPARS